MAGFSAGIEQSLSDPFGSRGRFADRHCGCGGRVAGGFVLTSNSETISIVLVVCRSLTCIGLELEIVNSNGCGGLRPSEFASPAIQFGIDPPSSVIGHSSVPVVEDWQLSGS